MDAGRILEGDFIIFYCLLMIIMEMFVHYLFVKKFICNGKKYFKNLLLFPGFFYYKN
jgi:hypothetical protein